MTEVYEYPEERSQRRLLPTMAELYPRLRAQAATGSSLQNGFAIFNLFDGAVRVAKVRLSVVAELKGQVNREDIELLTGSAE